MSEVKLLPHPFLFNKGISEETVQRAGVHVETNRIEFYYPSGGKKVRSVAPDFRSFKSVGLDRELYYLEGSMDSYEACFLVEGETDALKLWQELKYDNTVFALSGVENNPHLDALDLYDTVYVILDNDAGYAEQSVERAWARIKDVLGKKAVCVHLPAEVNDVCDFFKGYTAETMIRLIDEALEARDEGVFHFNALDLFTPPEPPDWALEGYIAQGAAAILVSIPGAGKSMWAMGLSVAVAEGHKTFAGIPLHIEGRVLYVDEENAGDDARRRLDLLGTNDRYKENIRYLSNQGVRLDKNPEKLIDEARKWDPKLVVLDSFVRFHNKDENSSGEMSGLFNDAIKPLAREVGAAVVYLHHVNKADGNNTFKNIRGSGDIAGAPDAVLELRELDEFGTLGFVHAKARRGKTQPTKRMQIVDTDSGLAIVHSAVTNPFN